MPRDYAAEYRARRQRAQERGSTYYRERSASERFQARARAQAQAMHPGLSATEGLPGPTESLGSVGAPVIDEGWHVYDPIRTTGGPTGDRRYTQSAHWRPGRPPSQGQPGTFGVMQVVFRDGTPWEYAVDEDGWEQVLNASSLHALLRDQMEFGKGRPG